MILENRNDTNSCSSGSAATLSSQPPRDVSRLAVAARCGMETEMGAGQDEGDGRDTNWVFPRESLRDDGHFSLTLRKNTDTSHLPSKEGKKMLTLAGSRRYRAETRRTKATAKMMTRTNVPSVKQRGHSSKEKAGERGPGTNCRSSHLRNSFEVSMT